jgi:hypothetical protein
MGYNIEVSFDIIKNSSVTQLQDTIRNVAKECECESFYEDYEYESHLQFNRNHCVMTANFSQTNIDELLYFLHFIKKTEGIFLELIYDDIANIIVYASQYYISQKMHKINGNLYKKERRERSYSDDENMILSIIKKHKN